MNRFQWQEHCHTFRGMPNWYTEAVRVFTKLLKPSFSILRSYGYLSVVFVDLSYLQGHTFSTCEDSVNSTVDLLQFLGFTIHPEKSVLVPTQETEFLGFVWNSVEVKIKLTDCKSGQIISKIKNLLYEGKQTIRDLASVIGSLVATFPVLPYGKLHYRELERCKISSLKFQKGKYNAPCMSLSTSAIAELHWWLKHFKNGNQSLQDVPVDCTIQTDASEQGWGATDGNTPIGGRWSFLERNHINVLELKAILLALKSYFRHNCRVKHVHIVTDNITAFVYINNMGGMPSVICNDIAKCIWEIAQKRDFWISSSPIPGAENTVADKMSRVFNGNTE